MSLAKALPLGFQHLEALGIHVSLWVWLVTLGGCRHLDGLEQRGSSSGGRCLSPALIMVIMRVLDLSLVESQKVL